MKARNKQTKWLHLTPYFSQARGICIVNIFVCGAPRDQALLQRTLPRSLIYFSWSKNLGITHRALAESADGPILSLAVRLVAKQI